MPENYLDKLDPWSSHSLIADYLQEFPPGTCVLDVGTATGTVGRLCKGFNFRILGIEPVKKWAEVSRPFYDEVFVESLQQISDSLLMDHDVIICADVLEHMTDPDVQLKRLVHLSPKAIFIVSVPNIANIWVRMNLLFGRFDYTDRGILDRTHLRFFTSRSAQMMVEGAGLSIKTIKTTPIPINLVTPFFADNIIGQRLHRALAFITRRFPSLLGYQFVITACKTS